MGVVKDSILSLTLSYSLLAIAPKSTISDVQEPKSQTFSFLSLPKRTF